MDTVAFKAMNCYYDIKATSLMRTFIADHPIIHTQPYLSDIPNITFLMTDL